MQKIVTIGIALILLAPAAMSQETDEDAAAGPAEEALAESPQSSADDQEATEGGAKTMSGMSILGNEEAPKSLVIIPWKSSELGEDISLSNTLDDRAQPVDKEVFLRELSFYEIRSGNEP